MTKINTQDIKIFFMPNTKSAIRRVRIVKKQTLTNRLIKSKYRSIIREINLLISAKKKKDAIKLLPKLNSQIMKIAKKKELVDELEELPLAVG